MGAGGLSGAEVSSAEVSLRRSFEQRQAVSLGDDQVVRASFIAQLVVMPREDGRGQALELIGARIVGDLDLSDCSVSVPMVFRGCRFEGDVLLDDARTSRIHMEDCEIGSVRAARLRCEGPLWLRGLQKTGRIDLEDAHIGGDLDLAGSRVGNDGVAVNLMAAQVDGDLVAKNVDLRGTFHLPGAVVSGRLLLEQAKIANESGIAVDGKSADVSLGIDARLARFTGKLQFAGARLGGDLNLQGAQHDRPGACAIDFSGAEVRGSAFLRGGFSCRGVLDCRHATISGQLRLDRSAVTDPHPGSGVAIALDWADIAGGVEATEPVALDGAINLVGTRVGGVFRIRGGQLNGRDGRAINAVAAAFGAGFRLEGASRLSSEIRMTACTISGDVMLDGLEGTSFHLASSTVSGVVSICSGKLVAPGGTALHIATSEISGDLMLTDLELLGDACQPAEGAEAPSSSADLLVSTAQLSDTTVRGRLHAGSLRCSGEVRLVNLVVPHVTFHGAALRAPGALVISGSNLTVDTLVLAELSAVGGVVLSSCEIGHVLRVTSAVITGGSRRLDLEEVGSFSLDLTGTKIGRQLNMAGSFFEDKVILADAAVGQDVRLDDARLGGRNGCALDATRLEASVLRLLPATAPGGAVRLANANVGLLIDRATSWPREHEVDLSGFTYGRLSAEVTLADRLSWLKLATPQFVPGPYEQLANCLTAAGDKDGARTVRLAAVRRSYRDVPPGLRDTRSVRRRIRYVFRRAWGCLQDSVLGYGYRSARALVLFVVLWVVGGAAFALGSGPCLRAGAPQAGPCPVKADEHPSWDPFLYALDLLIPLLDLGHEKAWDVIGPSKAVMWVLMVSGWVLATAIIAAASRTLRRS
ncbi:hypothetical protein [Saccharopolyspora hirsuta]